MSKFKFQFSDLVKNVSAQDGEKLDETSKVAVKTLDDEKEKFNLDTARKDQEAREDFQDKIFSCVLIYIAIVLLIVIVQGFGNLDNKMYFHLESGVLIALLTTTTANVLALLFIVMKYLFYRGPTKAK